MMEEIVTAVISLIVGGGFTTIFLIKERKKSEQLKNESSALKNNASSSEEWQKLFNELRQDNKDKDSKIDSIYGEISKYRDDNNKLTTENAILELKKCDVNGCLKRTPPRGF